jgi:hypothetical protein
LSTTSGPADGRRLQRLGEELEESGLPLMADPLLRSMLVEEVDQALRPPVHERRAASSGTILEPAADQARWATATHLTITLLPVKQRPIASLRRLADGLSSWLVRRARGDDEWLLFDRPAGSERDLTVLAAALQATIVQRHPSGAVRVVGDFGVLRWEGLRWHHEPPVESWLGAITTDAFSGNPDVMRTLVEFAIHDLGAIGIGALLVYNPDGAVGAGMEDRLPSPPALDVQSPAHLAPLRHVLSQLDGAAVFDGDGVLRGLGVRLVPSPEAEAAVEPIGGTRHTSARRFSYDHPSTTVVAISEDGPVSVLRAGQVLGRSPDGE